MRLERKGETGGEPKWIGRHPATFAVQGLRWGRKRVHTLTEIPGFSRSGARCARLRIIRQNGSWPLLTVLEHPDAIRHFQSLCDACQELTHRHHGPTELRLYADGYLHALRRTGVLDHNSQRKLEALIDRWIRDPSSFIGPDGNFRTLFESRPY